MTRLCLWHTFLSPYVEKVKIALHEKGLDFDLVMPGGIGVGVDGDLVSVNPRSEVPALVDGDVTIFDSSIILEYIEDKWPTPPLRAATPAGRARARMIEEVCDTHYEAVNWGLYELNYFRRGQQQGIADALMANARADTALLHDWLEQQLGDDDWFAGTAFGMADVAVVPFVAGSALHGLTVAPSRPLGRWYARAAARASVSATLAESHGDLSILNSVAGMLDEGKLKRHYRDHRLEWMVRAGGLRVVTDGLAAGNIRFTDLARLKDLPRLTS